MKFILGIIVLVLIGIGVYYAVNDSPVGPGNNSTSTATSTNTGSKTYNDTELGVSFSYPDLYFAEKKDLSTAQRKRYAIVLMEDTEENRGLASSTIPREGPTAITVELYQNDLDKQSALTWVKGSNNSNFKLGDQTYSSTTVDGKEGIRYRWSGLYEGESVVIADDRWVYMLSVTYLTPQDRIRGDFDTVVANFRRIQSQQ